MSSSLDRLPDALLIACETGDLTEAAYAWARLGVPVLPLYGVGPSGRCQCGQPNCPHAGKHPHSEQAKSGYKSATRDRSRLNYIFSTVSNCNLGLRMAAPRGALSLVALDIDVKRDGFLGLDRLQETYGRLPNTLRIKSGGGGEHYLFTLPQKIRPRSREIVRGVEFKGDRSLLVAAPSRHRSGNRYEIVDDHPPVLLPENWLQLASRPASWGSGKVAGYRHRGGEGARNHGYGALDLEQLPLPLRNEVARVKAAMLEGPNAGEAAGLLAGNRDANPGPDTSDSGDDFHLGRCAKRFTQDPEVIDAILRSSGLYRPKYLRPDYLPRTIEKVLYDDPDWHADQQARRIHPVGKRGVPVRHRVMQAIIDYCQDQHPCADEFIGLPVNEIARSQSVSFDTVTRAINDLEQAGKLVTKVERQRTKTGGWKCTRWVKLTASGPVALITGTD